ncbi:MAG: N-acetylglucosamine-6-phosphate deacetylase [Lachnospiraceae bacterium]|nr:N-acetylglucosamine-6-phosphate deacetylase [Lachnospiraceae bacterium]
MIIKNAKVYTSERGFEERDIFISGKRIVEKGDASDGEIDARGLYAVPGFIDIHFHGAAGSDICDATYEALNNITRYELKRGVMTLCPATMTYSEEILTRVVENIRDFTSKEKDNYSLGEIVGINMEGPFISKKKMGAQNPKYQRNPDVGMFERLLEKSGGLIKLVDIAPENEGAMEFIKRCHEKVCISLAHMTADYDTAVKAFEAGAKHMTHLYNAMPGIHHREPGPIIAALEKDAQVELIADGVHVHPAMVRFTFNTFKEDKIILISDSMEATGLVDGIYQLGGQSVTKKGARAALTEDENTIAGSVTDLYDCFKRAVLDMKVPLEKAVRGATENPAMAIGIDKDYGSLKAGHFANILLLDDELNIVKMIYKGRPDPT